MSVVGAYTARDFEQAFPIDLGSSTRAERVKTSMGFDGLIVSHLLNSGEACSTVITFAGAEDKYRKALGIDLWGLLNEDPAHLTVDRELTCINCPEHRVGNIQDGCWQPSS